MQFLVFLYLVLLCRSIIIGDWTYKIIMVVVGILFVLIVFGIRKFQIKNAKKKVALFEQNPKAKVKPFINVNRHNWYVLQELPHISRVQAKKIVWMRKHNGWYTSLEDFFKKNNIYDDEQKQALSKIIDIK